MTIESQCYFLFRIDSFIRAKCLSSKYRLLQAFGAFGINFLMGFSYATVLQIGQKEAIRRKRGKKSNG